ncbi:CHAT domain-containing protein [Roseococcus sp.]|uniref:CHAT domain-containing tetratricopeptide repeat protein n=1 Tax=Roseococcus sp. TaxID=2109646 RepID=UPI003BAA62A5
MMRASFLALLALAGCNAPPPSAYVSEPSGGGAGMLALGATASGEECRMSRSGQGGDVWCGEWSSPSARVRPAVGTTPMQAAEEARAGLASRLDCAAPRASTALGGLPAALMDCRRRAGGWPAFAMTVQSGSQIWLAEGVLPAQAAAERAIGVASGRIAAEAAPLPSAAIDQMAARLAREAFSTGDIGRYESLMAIGRDANQAERFVAAETAYRAALSLQERALGAQAPDRFLPMLYLALQLSNQGRYPEAEAFFNRAALLVPRASEPLASAHLAHYRGLHEANRGHHDRALALLAQGGVGYARWVPPELRAGMGGAQPSVDPLVTRALIGLIETRRNTAAVLRAAGRYAEAETTAADAARLSLAANGTSSGNDVIAARIARTEGAVAAGTGRSSAAASDFGRSATRFARGIPRSRPLAETLLLRAANLSPSSAVGPCREAAAVLRNLREGTSPLRIAPCVDAFIALGTPEGLAEAFEAAQLGQGGVTTTQIATAAARLAAGARNPAVAEALRRRDEADRLLATSYRERDAAAAEGRDVAALTARINEAEAAAAEADAAAQSAAPGYGQLVQSVASAAEVLSALAPGEALVATTQPPDRRGWTFVLLDGNLSVGRVGADTAEITALVARIRASTESGTSRRPFEAGAAYALHQALFGAVAEPMGRARSMVALAEGAMLSLPYGLLVTAAPPAPLGHERVAFLVQKMPVTHVPAAASLVTLRRAGNSVATRPWFGFGDPRPVPAAFAARSFPAEPSCGQGLSSLARLPAAEIELQAAQQAMGATAAERRTGDAFTLSSVRAANLRNYRILHFATHGVLPAELTCLTEPAIIASAGNGPTATQALLTAGTILDLNLDADLVVLSACNSGGGAAAGESLSTLARAFFFSGARGLLVTHWYVNDVAAARIAFFTLENIKKGDAPAEALRKAQIGLMGTAGQGHPALWAPFAMIGPGPAAPVRTARAG